MRLERSPRSVALAIVATLFVGPMAPTSARAQPAPPAPGAALADDAGSRAVALGREGVQLYEAGAWAAAEAKLTEADTILHSPVFVLYIARSRRNAGRLLDARDTYRRMVGEALAPTAPPTWHQALVDARAELAVLEPSIPTIAVRVPDGSPATEVSIDGRTVAIGAAVELDPGPRRVVIVDGARRAEAAVDVRVGDRDRVVEIALTPAALPAPATRGAAPIEDHPRPPHAGGSWVPGAVVLGLGAIGLGVGAVTGAMALGEGSEVEDACPDGVCPAGVAPGTHDAQLADAQALADVSTVAFIAGGALAATGVVLLVLRPFGGDDAGEVAVRAGAGRLDLRGSF